jgi:hypothetical protein
MMLVLVLPPPSTITIVVGVSVGWAVGEEASIVTVGTEEVSIVTVGTEFIVATVVMPTSDSSVLTLVTKEGEAITSLMEWALPLSKARIVTPRTTPPDNCLDRRAARIAICTWPRSMPSSE